MTFREVLHRQLEALGRSDLYARLFATPVEIHESSDAALAVLHLLYCEDAPGKRPDNEPEAVGARRPVLHEQLIADDPHLPDRRSSGRHVRDLAGDRASSANARQACAGVGVLRPYIRQPVGVAGILHPPIGIVDRHAAHHIVKGHFLGIRR